MVYTLVIRARYKDNYGDISVVVTQLSVEELS